MKAELGLEHMGVQAVVQVGVRLQRNNSDQRLERKIERKVVVVV